MAENGREKNGQFAKGNQFAKGHGKGRPPKEREQRYYEIAMQTVTYAQWERIVKRAADDAEKGDATARKWLITPAPD